MSQDNNITKGLVIGFLAGGALGSILALLYAPKSGKELRGDIKAKTDEYLDEADKYIAEARDRAKELINDGKKRSEKLISDAKVKSDAILKDAEKIFSDAKTKANDYIATGKTKIDEESHRIKESVKAGVDAYKDAKKN